MLKYSVLQCYFDYFLRSTYKSTRSLLTCKAQNLKRDMGLKSLKQILLQPGVIVLQTNFPCSSLNIVSAMETSIRYRRTKKKVTQNFPTNVECSPTCSRYFCTKCQPILITQNFYLKSLNDYVLRHHRVPAIAVIIKAVQPTTQTRQRGQERADASFLRRWCDLGPTRTLITLLRP